MLDEKRIKEAESNVRQYLAEGLIKKQENRTAKEMYLENSNLSLETAQKLLSLETNIYKPYLWVIISSYYSMYYIANAVLLEFGYKVGDKISHKVTSDALIVFARNKLKKELIEGYENIKEDALELISQKTDNLLQSFDLEREKRSKFQYQMDEKAKQSKALTSLERAKEFVFEMKKLLS
ncbi:hypothetical protein A3K73_03650 [Candidatus Pacearchaeota archaeon RBG_13_36_9]|nr:MAG: hypothetical protein A3K73_03650 [Candidatus Pacearchaeota archaeon RBG_13_36_9]